jgi:hypothetical protein
MSDTIMSARDAIGAYLERHDLVHEARDGAVLVAFGGDGATTAAFTARLHVADDGGIVVEAASTRGLPEERWEHALWTVNEWNATVRAPKAALVTTRSTDDERVAHIVLQDWLPFTPGVPVEVVDAFLDTTLAGASVFWQGTASPSS